MRIADRLRRLEDDDASVRNIDTNRADAAHLLEAVERLASRFPASAASITLQERVATMSPAQHCAWEIRFAAEQTPVASIMAMHGHPFPTALENQYASF